MGSGFEASRARARKDSLLMAAPSAQSSAPNGTENSPLCSRLAPWRSCVIERAFCFVLAVSEWRGVRSEAGQGGFRGRHFSWMSREIVRHLQTVGWADWPSPEVGAHELRARLEYHWIAPRTPPLTPVNSRAWSTDNKQHDSGGNTSD